MKIVAISDLHGDPIDLPDGDVLCIAGDTVPLDYQRNLVKSVAWFCLEFVPWIDSLNFRKVIFIAGNHDFFLEELSKKCYGNPREVLTHLLPGNNKGKHKLIYLQDNSYEFEGIKFYGTPWISNLSGWAFYKSHDDLVEVYNKIPREVDVLLTHQPPRFGNAGVVLQNNFNHLSNYGSQELAETISVRKIKWNLCGHVHSGDHNITTINDYTNIVNVSIKDERYMINYQPFVFEI